MYIINTIKLLSFLSLNIFESSYPRLICNYIADVSSFRQAGIASDRQTLLSTCRRVAFDLDLTFSASKLQDPTLCVSVPFPCCPETVSEPIFAF